MFLRLVLISRAAHPHTRSAYTQSTLTPTVWCGSTAELSRLLIFVSGRRMGGVGSARRWQGFRGFSTKIYVALIASHLPPNPPPPTPTPSWCKSFKFSPAGGEQYGLKMPILKSNSTQSSVLLLLASRVFCSHSFQPLWRHLRETNSDHIKPLARLLTHQARAQVSTWDLSLKDSPFAVSLK